MVRISIPNLPVRPPTPLTGLSIAPVSEASAHLGDFIRSGNGRTLVITGAGVSVDSGIRAYRGSEGAYSNPNYQPIFYSELVEDSPRGEMFRRRYWARSFLGYPPVRDALPNPNHIYVAALQSLGLANGLITQNVDNLHRKALAILEKTSPFSSRPSHQQSILELHGTLAHVHCLKHGHGQTRDSWQDQLASLNPLWAEQMRLMEETGEKPRTNPDGDVELVGADYTTFDVADCRTCAAKGEPGSIVKPNVVFFGETLAEEVKSRSFDMVDKANNVLVLGTTLATYSAFRLLKMAREQDKPVLTISLGPSRGDGLEGVEKMERLAGPVLKGFLQDYLGTSKSTPEIDAVRSLLDAGVIRRLPDMEATKEVQYPP